MAVMVYKHPKNKFSTKTKSKLISIFTTILIVSLLIISGPVSAVIVKVDVDSSIYNNNDEIVFTVQVDIETDERLPVQNFTLKITNSSGNVIKTCTFAIDGTNITACSNLNITPINTGVGAYDNSTLWGYGFGYNYSNPSSGWSMINATLGTDYGYGYMSGYAYNQAYGAEFMYNVTWNINSENLQDGTYYANLEVIVQKNGNAYAFKQSDDTSFSIDNTPPSITVISVGGDTLSPYIMSDSTPTIKITTSESATCRYASSDVAYDSMTNFDITGATSHSANLSYLSDGKHTYYIRCRDSVNNEAAKSIDFIVSTPGPAKGGAAAPQEPKYMTTIPSIPSGESVTITIKKSDEYSLTEITIAVKDSVNDVQVIVQKLAGKPSTIIDEVMGSVYRYLRITTQNLDNENIENVNVQFKVEKSWLEENNLNPHTVLLNQYSEEEGKWNGLVTEMVGEDDDYYYYEASLQGFSVFAISAGEETAAFWRIIDLINDYYLGKAVNFWDIIKAIDAYYRGG